MMLPFHRSTLPEREHEGVMYDRDRLGRSVTLTGTGQDWCQMHLQCRRCPYSVQVSRERIESRLAAMWAPYAKRQERVVWDAPA